MIHLLDQEHSVVVMKTGWAIKYSDSELAVYLSSFIIFSLLRVRVSDYLSN